MYVNMSIAEKRAPGCTPVLESVHENLGRGKEHSSTDLLCILCGVAIPHTQTHTHMCKHTYTHRHTHTHVKGGQGIAEQLGSATGAADNNDARST